jgi:GGDEF domain-containing protein
MKNANELLTRKLFLYIILLVIWGTVSNFLLIRFSPTTAVLGIALNLFTLVFSLTNLFPSATWVGLVISVALYAGSGYSLLNVTQDFLLSAGVGALIFLVTALIAEINVRRLHQIDEDYSRLQQVTDSLVIYDRQTSLMRWKFAEQALTTEILRGRRYHSDVSLVLFDYRQKDQLTKPEIQRINKVISEVIHNSIRTQIDIGFINGRIGLILPETPLEGALVLTNRLVQNFNRLVDTRMVAGVANFPDDAITDEDLLDRAKTAVLFALNSEQSVMDFAAIGIEAEPQSLPEPQEQIEEQPYMESEQTISDSHDDYVAILEGIDLAENEWIAWVEGFNQMSDLVNVERKLQEVDHIQSSEFLFLQSDYLVIKLRTSLTDFFGETDPLPGWEIKKSNPEYRYLLIAQKE